MAEPRLDKYKVLRAAAAVPEFTVRDLARNTGVEANYVSKLISGSDEDFKELFEEVGTLESGKPGRPPTQYRIANDQHDRVRETLSKLSQQLKALTLTTKPGSKATAELLAAEHVLFHELPGAQTPEDRDALLQTAALDLKADEERLKKMDVGQTPDVDDPRRAAARVLLELAEFGLGVADGAPRKPLPSFGRVTQLLADLGKLGQMLAPECSDAIQKWLTNGPLGRLQLASFLGLRSEKTPLPTVPNRLECWPETTVCPFLAAVPRSTSGSPSPAHPVAGRRVDLVRSVDGDVKVGLVADQVLKALRIVTPRLEVCDRPSAASTPKTTEPIVAVWGASGEKPPLSADVRMALVACNSERPSKTDFSGWDSMLKIAEQWGQIACSLFVLDASSDPEFMDKVHECKAQYVPYATRLDKDSLFLEVPALTQLLHGERLATGS